ncbi:MAG: hypothetical protein NTY38_17460 [Acidobacteria bacterium]|nr:hypothetical protein [Acidobacteriota bacterium]
MRSLICALTLLACGSLSAQTIAESLAKPVLDPLQPGIEARIYTGSHVPPLNIPTTPAAWTKYANNLRARIFNEVIFHGEAKKWRDAKTGVEWLDTIEASDYRIRKLRYEAVPGLWVPANLYEPKTLTGKTVGVLNLSGHEALGKAEHRWQINCINQAKRGIVSLKSDWLGIGQLKYTRHGEMNQIDLTGASGIAVFYLVMSRGIDILTAHQHVDPARIAVTGLSGGGWQTIVISSLDTRVALSNPVAGYSSFITKSYMPDMDLGDSEQSMTDLGSMADYLHLTALLAPRWLQISNNAKDNCCFRADYAPAPLLNGAAPVFKLLGMPGRLSHFVSYDPGHNYDRANREAFYAALKRAFYANDPKFTTEEIDVSADFRTPEELSVPLPEGNLSMNALAKELARDLPRPVADAAAARRKLAELVRPRSYKTEWHLRDTVQNGTVTAYTYQISLSDSWTVPAVVLFPGKSSGKTALLLSDEGRASVADAAQTALDAGDTVIAVDLLNFGENHAQTRDWLWMITFAALGDRALGLQASQLQAVVRSAPGHHPGKVTVEAWGKRASLATLVAAALNPELIASSQIHGARESLKELIDQNIVAEKEPESFCRGLLEYFDIPQLRTLAGAR